MNRVIVVTKNGNEIVAVHHAMECESKNALRKIIRQFRRDGRIDASMTIIWEVL